MIKIFVKTNSWFESNRAKQPYGSLSWSNITIIMEDNKEINKLTETKLKEFKNKILKQKIRK